MSYFPGATAAAISAAQAAAIAASQPVDADLTALAALTATTDSFVQAKGGAWSARTIAQVKTDLGISGTNTGDQTLTHLIGVVTYSGSLSDARPTADAVYWVGYPSAPTNAQSQDIVASASTVVADTSFTLQDASDATKQVQFDVASGQTTGTTRVFTLPAVSGTFATKDGTETLTSKTLNGCTINSPTGLAKTDVGLGSVDNTSDATKNSASATLTNKTLTNPTITGYTESTVAIGTVTSSSTISLTSGTVQTATLTASTACTFTMPSAAAGKSFVLYLKQAASTGNGTATFTSVKWPTAGAPTVTATAGKMDIFSFVSDGTNWYGSVVQGYTY